MDWKSICTVIGTGVVVAGLMLNSDSNIRSDMLTLHGQLREDIRSLNAGMVQLGDRLDDRLLGIDKRLSRVEGSLEVRLPSQP